MRGVNWIPDDVFPTRVTRDRLAHRFDQAAEANVNLLRVWGGGRYESDDFYDLADERGLLVQQDFLFACAAYPEEEPFAAEVAAEARRAGDPARAGIRRWCCGPATTRTSGAGTTGAGRRPLAGRTWGRGYYLDLLPADRGRAGPDPAVLAGQPVVGQRGDPPQRPGARHHAHLGRLEHRRLPKYREYLPRFVAEFGYQGPPAYATLRRALSDEPLAPDSPGMAHHQKAADGDREAAPRAGRTPARRRATSTTGTT